jgi:hypothetical protein
MIYICENLAEVNISKAALIPNYSAMFNIWKKVSIYNHLKKGLDGTIDVTTLPYDTST